jgi:hypothetical protein
MSCQENQEIDTKIASRRLKMACAGDLRLACCIGLLATRVLHRPTRYSRAASAYSLLACCIGLLDIESAIEVMGTCMRRPLRLRAGVLLRNLTRVARLSAVRCHTPKMSLLQVPARARLCTYAQKSFVCINVCVCVCMYVWMYVCMYVCV